MGKNRTVKNIIKKKIVISNNKESIIKKSIKENKKPILITTPQKLKKRSIKIIDPKDKINRRKQIIIPKGLNKHRTRDFNRTGIDITKKKKKKKYVHTPVYYEYPPYVKTKDVDFDVAICLSSYDRYLKVKKLLEQIYIQKTKYTFKVFLINDGSNLATYGRFKKMFPDMVYRLNRINGGKIGYWNTVSKVWSAVKEYNTHALCQLDDDFVLCDGFIDRMMDKYFECKNIENGYMAFRLHSLVFNDAVFNDIESQSVDGGTLYDINFMKKINYSVERTTVNNNYDASNVWVNITKKIREYGIRVFRFPESLVFHDGNDDSKLNPYIRKIKRMNTVHFIDDK